MLYHVNPKTVRLFTLALLSLCVSVHGHAQLQPTMTRHVRDVTATGLARTVSHLTSETPLKLGITLPIRDPNGLNAFLKDVYDPESPNYRHFLTVDQFTERFSPTEQTYNALLKFASDNGFTIHSASPNRLHLDIEGSVPTIEKAFHVSLGLYQHPSENRTFYAPDREPTVNLPFRLWHISGLDSYSPPRPATPIRNPLTANSGATPNASYGSGPASSFLGSDMRAAYYGATTLTGAGQSVGLFEFNSGFNQSDLTSYFANSGLPVYSNVYQQSTDGTPTACVHSNGCDDTEQIIDVTQAIGMAPKLAFVQMFVGGTDSSIFNAMATDTTNGLINQLSVSWIWAAADTSTDDPYFQEFAAQGQNVFVASGDNGSWPTTKAYYYPAEDAYVTSVGGTDLQTISSAGPWSYESAWIAGGGGISPDHISIPSWQTSAANSCASCSKTYRNAPDVSANANYTFYVCANQTACTTNYEGGTSFAAPMWAGYLALANQQSVANTGKVLGFINPTLYSIAAGSSYTTNFHDVTAGNNGGFTASTGYDLSTGLGSPNGANLITSLLAGPLVATKTASPYVSNAIWQYTQPLHHTIYYVITVGDGTPSAVISYAFYDSSNNNLNSGTTTSGSQIQSSAVGTTQGVYLRLSATAPNHPTSGWSGEYSYTPNNTQQ